MINTKKKQLEYGRKKINGVMSRIQSMIDDLDEGKQALESHRSQNEEVIKNLNDENTQINSELEVTQSFRNFLNQANHM